MSDPLKRDRAHLDKINFLIYSPFSDSSKVENSGFWEQVILTYLQKVGQFNKFV